MSDPFRDCINALTPLWAVFALAGLAFDCPDLRWRWVYGRRSHAWYPVDAWYPTSVHTAPCGRRCLPGLDFYDESAGAPHTPGRCPDCG
jgi:hypothetical protein